MKKQLALIITLAVMLPSFSTFAEASDPMSVQMISGPEEEEAEPVSLDDVKIGNEIEIDGFGTVTFTSFEYNDKLEVAHVLGGDYYSGNEADYACLYIDVLNTTLKEKDYFGNAEVKAIYDDSYVYSGWSYQFNYDDDREGTIDHDSRYMFSIAPMYTGHYVFGATLPNAVINGDKELRLEIIIDGNEMTYYIQK